MKCDALENADEAGYWTDLDVQNTEVLHFKRFLIRLLSAGLSARPGLKAKR
jgi:hypothetical protein